MYQIADCTLTEQEVSWLTTLFVAKEAPYYFESNDVALTNALLQAGLLVYNRNEFAANFPDFSLAYGYVYHVWHVVGDLILLADEQRLRLLNDSIRQTLFQKQVQAGRGHLYQETWLQDLANTLPKLQRDQLLHFINQHTWKHEGQHILLLTHELWSTLTPPTQQAWIIKWLAEQLQDDQGDTVDVTLADMQVRPEVAALAMEYAGRLPNTVSANCFAAALGLAIGKREAAEIVMQRWLHPGPFFRSLSAIGYEKAGEHHLHDTTFALHGEDVLVWIHPDGQAIHAAYLLAPDLLFQKMGQSWAQLWRFIRYSSVFDYGSVLTNGGRIDVYRVLHNTTPCNA